MGKLKMKNNNDTSRKELKRQIIEKTILTGQKFMKTKILEDWTLSNDIMDLIDQHTKTMCERARQDELKQLWNSTQPDIVPSGIPANDMSEQLHKRIAELQSTIKTNRSI